MPLSDTMKHQAEQEVFLWARETGSTLQMTGHMKDQVRIITAETLFRRMQQKYPDEMKIYNIDDLKESVFEDGDYFNDNWFTRNATAGAKTIQDDGRMPSGSLGDHDDHNDESDEQELS